MGLGGGFYFVLVGIGLALVVGMRNRFGVSIPSPQILASAIVAMVIILIQLASMDLFRADRCQHILISAIAFITLYGLFNGQTSRLFIAVTGAMLIGLFKEFTDPSYDFIDIGANSFGVVFAFMGVLLWNSITANKAGIVSRHRSSYVKDSLFR